MDHKDTAVLVQEYSREEYMHHGDTAFLILEYNRRSTSITRIQQS
jgi:hypothetical protein